MSDISTLVDGLGLTEEQIIQLTQNLATLQSAKLLELDSDIARVKSGMRITKNGLDMLARANTGSKLTFTRVVLGDAIKNGSIVTPTDEQILNYTKLIHQRDIDLPLADVRFGGRGTAIVRFQLSNAQLETGFWAREIGLYAKIDDGSDMLYAYKNNGNLSTFIPPNDGAVAMNLIISLITIVDQASNVTAIVDANLLFVSEAEYIEHINSTHPHPNIPNLSSDVVTSNYIWVTGDDLQLHRISAENLQTQLLGSSLYELPHLSNRISQTEINLSNLYTQLGRSTDTGLEANLLIAEDFMSGEMIDQFSVKVNDAVAGADNICVESFDGILEGHYYTISDGVRSQYMRVRAIARNGDLNVIFFESPMTKTFNLKKTYLYRTTGMIQKGGASGGGDVNETLIRFGDVTWLGEEAGSAKNLNLTTTVDRANKFTLSGDYDFTSDGMFTLT